MSDLGKGSHNKDTGRNETSKRTADNTTRGKTNEVKENKASQGSTDQGKKPQSTEQTTVVRRGREVTVAKGQEGVVQHKGLAEIASGMKEVQREQTVHTHLTSIDKHLQSGRVEGEQGQRISREITQALHNQQQERGADWNSIKAKIAGLEKGLTDGNMDRVRDHLSELAYANKITQEGLATSRVMIGATGADDLKDGGRTLQIRDTGEMHSAQVKPVSEADALFFTRQETYTRDGKTEQRDILQITEVKSTAAALYNKMEKTPEQLANLVKWRDAEPETRKVEIAIDTDKKWTDLFSRTKDTSTKSRQPVIEQLIRQGIPVSIGDYRLDTQKLTQLNQFMNEKAREMNVGPGGMSVKDFVAHFENGLSSIAVDFERKFGSALKD